MTSPATPQPIGIAAPESADFARLSGDFNPLHVDALAARRLQFGSTVCHGIHLVLKALDGIAASGALQGRGVASISAVFHQAVRTGAPVSLGIRTDTDGARIRCSGQIDGRPGFSVQLVLGDAADTVATADAEPESASDALAPAFPADEAARDALRGALPLRANAALLARLFPALSAWPEGCSLAADLMASTRLVGMHCPGLNSVYGEFKLRRRAAPAASASLGYRVVTADPRFRLVRMAVEGGLLEGTVDAFFRTPPVAQRSLADISALTAPGCTRGQRALVVGGSRGLGELVAKMLLAGGAEVTLSYARGEQDAARIVAEAQAQGAACSMLALDAAAPLPPALVERLAASRFTHLYYFATPAISKGGAAWNPALFDAYCRVYVTGLAELARACAGAVTGAAPLHVFYPSTVFLDAAEKGFAEYCAAKAAGETLCAHLALEPSRFVVQYPRLPRVKTDQNSGFLGPEADDPLPVMAGLLGAFCGWRAA